MLGFRESPPSLARIEVVVDRDTWGHSFLIEKEDYISTYFYRIYLYENIAVKYSRKIDFSRN